MSSAEIGWPSRSGPASPDPAADRGAVVAANALQSPLERLRGTEGVVTS
jgi:hypothetical protein